MNIREIAELAGVSTSTVSKIVNHKDDSIADATRERVLKVVKQYHYRPYASAKTEQRSWRIGVLLRDSVSMDTTIDGIIQTAQKRGYTALTYNSFKSAKQENLNIQAALAQHVDGLIWEPVSGKSLKSNSSSPSIDIPELTIGPLGDDEFTMLPYEQAAYSLAEELIKRQHSKIACLLSPGRRTQSFLNGFRRCLFEHNLELNDDMIFYEINDRLMAAVSEHRITGVVSSHYQHALELLQFASRLHYRVPQDFSILSVRNDTSEILRFPGSSEVSSYTMRNADFGAYLCTRMINAIEHGRKEAPGFSQSFHLGNERTIAGPFNQERRNIVVVGSANLDTYFVAPTLPRPGTIVDSQSLLSIPGGKGVNQAVGVAKLGQPVSLIANVGADSAADQIYHSLTDNGVNTDGVQRKAYSETGKAYIFVDDTGESMTTRVAGANALLNPNDVSSMDKLFDHAAYCLIQTVVPLPAIEEACRVAHAHGAQTIVKPFFCAELPDNILSQCDILVPNRKELAALCPKPASQDDKAKELLARGVGTVIVTTGEEGCVLYQNSKRQPFPTTRAKVVDDTGASDAFISALASYLLYGRSLGESIKMANRAATYSLSREGVLPSLAERHQIEKSTEL
ncbi:LacI family transcriptional regulator [Bombiscardovia apis]|uniref:Ribokinase n=1 Tax=Bombiscardovia apis TaxID=2932182 RepID=A0ABM8BAP9_9BIFI|nr:PfkB family carbohydrate kinase [Bombiscardovia apis]BDR53993.1 LacI family transcriptional regulator [Bombiscardovia apis]